VVNWTRWLGELDLGVERERETSGGHLTGPTASWELPIFNQHEDTLLRANADLQIAVFELRRITMEVDNSVTLAHTALLNARDRVEEYREALIPQRVQAVEQAQKEVNFMLIGIFELINLKQAEYDAYQGYLESIRDYWLDRVALTLAVGNALPKDVKEESNSVDVEMLTSPMATGIEKASEQPAVSDHAGHKMQETESPQSPAVDHSGHSMKNSDQADTASENDNGGTK